MQWLHLHLHQEYLDKEAIQINLHSVVLITWKFFMFIPVLEGSSILNLSKCNFCFTLPDSLFIEEEYLQIFVGSRYSLFTGGRCAWLGYELITYHWYYTRTNQPTDNFEYYPLITQSNICKFASSHELFCAF